MSELILAFDSSDLSSSTREYIEERTSHKGTDATVIPVQLDSNGKISDVFQRSLHDFFSTKEQCSITLIGAHGTSASDVFILNPSKNQIPIPAKDLALILKDYSEKIRKIKVLSCHSAEGDTCLAATIAQIACVTTVGYRHLVYLGKDPSPRLCGHNPKESRRLSRVSFTLHQKELRRDFEREIALLKSSPLLEKIQLASPAARADRTLMLAAVRRDGRILLYAAAPLRADREFVLAAVQQSGTAIKYAADYLRTDKELVLIAIKRDKYAFLDLAFDNPLRADPEVVLAAINQEGRAFCYAADSLKTNKEFVLAAVQQNGDALEYAAAHLQADPEVVLTAINQKGNAFRYAAPHLQANPEIALAAIKKDPSVFIYAAETLQKNKMFVLAAVKQNGLVFKYVAPNLQADPEIALAAVK